MANGKGSPSCACCEHVTPEWRCALHQADLPLNADGRNLICAAFDPSYRYYEDHPDASGPHVGRFRFATYLAPGVLYAFHYNTPEEAEPLLRFAR